MGYDLGVGIQHMAVGFEMGLNLLLIIGGLVASGFGLSGKSNLRLILAPVGWCLFLVGVLQLMVPGFF